MNRESYVTAVVAVLCISAVGFSAAHMDQALGTDPDDVVDLEYDKLPIGKDDAGELDRQVQTNKEEGQGATAGGGSSNDGDSQSDSDAGDNSETSAADSAEQGDETGGGETDGDVPGVDDGRQPGLAAGPTSSLLDLLPWLVLVAVLALAYRYRRRLLALALVLLGATPEREDDEEDVPAEWYGVEPSNEVHRAWLAMVDSLPVDRPWTRTPSECADIARETGADPEAVEQVTEAFEEVRYGGRPVTEERRERAREGLERLRGRGEGQ